MSSRRNSENHNFDYSSIIQTINEGGGKLSDVLIDDLESKHLLLTSLLNYIDSADYTMSYKAMEGILIVTSFHDEIAARNAIKQNYFPKKIIERLIYLFDSLPDELDPRYLQDFKVNWMEAYYNLKPSDPDFEGKVELMNFYTWFDFVDNLIRSSHPLISASLLSLFREMFLENCLEVSLGSHFKDENDDEDYDDDEGIVLLLAIIGQLWLHVSSSDLALDFSHWLIGQDPGLEVNAMKPLLIEMALSGNSDLSIETLHLFEKLLDRPCIPILNGLVISYLDNRGYYNYNAGDINSWSEEEDEREKKNIRKSPSRTLAPSNIHRVVNVWLFLVSEELKIGKSSGGGYESYLATANGQFIAIRDQCGGFAWPTEAVFPDIKCSDTSRSDSGIVEDKVFFEGEFLSMIFSLLGGLLSQDYSLNLQITSVLSKLCLLPHPYVHEYLLNPTIPIIPGTKTLHSTLKHLLKEANDKIKNIENFPNKLNMCRKSLLERKPKRKKSDSSTSKDNPSPEEIIIINGIIVLEEFCKELAAIAYSKYNNSI